MCMTLELQLGYVTKLGDNPNNFSSIIMASLEPRPFPALAKNIKQGKTPLFIFASVGKAWPGFEVRIRTYQAIGLEH